MLASCQLLMKKQDLELDPDQDPYICGTDPRIRIRILTKMIRIHNSDKKDVHFSIKLSFAWQEESLRRNAKKILKIKHFTTWVF
jgi:hypothetical protein